MSGADCCLIMQVLVVALNPERGEEECAITINALLHNPKLGQAAAQHLQAIYSETVAAAPLQGALSLGVSGSPRRKNNHFLKNGTKCIMVVFLEG